MENKINIARFKEGSRTAEVKDIWQWDYGQILRIQGLSLPTAVEIHFSLDEHGGEAARRIGVTKDGVTDVPIPDSMVENESAYGDSYYFFAYIYLTDETSGNTEYKIRAKVSTRSKPEAFNKPGDEELFRQAIDAVGKSADRAEDAEKSAEAWAHGREDYPDLVDDNAAYYAASAHDSMIETQHLAERVHSDADATARNAALAEQYKSQAAQSATDALQSEQNAKASETAAQEARAGAETAEGQAELFAAQAEEDKNTVEQGKAVVMEIGQKVEDNKKTVEQTVDNFKLLHEQAAADVNNAGQAQTERVNKSGETAVDNIEFSSKQAVQYVANEGATQVANVQAAAEEITGNVKQIEQNTQGISELKSDISNKITKFYASNQGEIHITDSDNGKIQDMMIYGKSSQDGTPTPENPVEIKSVVNPVVKVCGKNLIDYVYDNSKNPNIKLFSKNVNLKLFKGISYTLTFYNKYNEGNASLYYDDTRIIQLGWYESKKTFTPDKNILVNRIDCDAKKNSVLKLQVELGSQSTDFEPYKSIQEATLPYTLNAIPVDSGGNVTIDGQEYIADYVDVERGKLVRMVDSSKLDNTQSIVNKTEWLLAGSQEIDLTQEEMQTLKALATYYPTTNISINSEQLDGYTVFNYPISMENGWNYVKQQIGDMRDYIYDMDTRTQDIDTQAAEAYVNSEYAVALTELEV